MILKIAMLDIIPDQTAAFEKAAEVSGVEKIAPPLLQFFPRVEHFRKVTL